MRAPIPTEGSFTSRLRSAAVAARVGLWLGICFGIGFMTGLVSHYAQVSDQPVPFPARPLWGYQLNQALHVIAGTAAVPLLLVKLWAVYPKLFAAPPRRLGELTLVALERGSIAVLVAGSILELALGVMNVSQWYAAHLADRLTWRFGFRETHYALGWIVVGALFVHIAVKLPIIREALAAPLEATGADRSSAVRPGALSRRGVLRTAWLAAGVAVVTGSTATGTLPGLDRLAVLSPRSRRSGIPINRTAAQVGVATGDPSYRCRVVNGERSVELALADLAALPQATHTLPIACVEGWTAYGTWTGVPVRALLDLVGAPRGSDVRLTSLQAGRVDELPAGFADDDRTLIALRLDGEPLTPDHGFPARLIAPGRPGALQTKWVTAIEVLA